MLIVSTPFISGKETGDLITLGLVTGSVVQSKHIGRDIMAGLKTIVGGELKGYTEMMNEARQIALQRMSDAASQMGADAVIMTAFATSAVMDGAAEIMAYGTAVRFAR